MRFSKIKKIKKVESDDEETKDENPEILNNMLKNLTTGAGTMKMSGKEIAKKFKL